MPFLREVVHAEKSQVQSPLMEVRNTGAQELARSFEGHKLGKASLGIPEKVGEQTRPPARWASAGAGEANAAVRAWQTLRTDVWDSTEKSRRYSQGSDVLVADGLRWNLSVLGSNQPTRRCPAWRPDLRPRRGRCRGFKEAGRASRLRDPSAPTPRTPRSRVAGSGVAGKHAASGDSVPAQAPHCPGQSRVSPARHPRLPGGSAPEGRARTATWAGTLSPESGEALPRRR